ncbi:hypothetical protein ERC79_14730 [Rhodococcus sp. ABRD24]|uniref:hypothetical protein n=1 Tax=Rhodococcus sp. ABRD24 TaxID=2507582 RepID=UPI001038B81F|nr:hypothetical protein [Rhodococcus sp. ABRD24]QBJ97061.1 hypothetical protein ERC79_14730 [Rhodococcus sp. ABRD24]
MRAVPETGADDAIASANPTRNRWWTPTSRQVLTLAVALVAVQSVVRAGVAFSGDFYWDDLILISRSGQYPALSGEFLFYDHDGHFMPAAFLAAWFATTVAPLSWVVPALMLILLQLLASLAVLRVLWLLLGPRPALLLPFAFYLFSPLTLPSFQWWAAGLNSLPMQIAIAWVAGDAIRLQRTARIRFAVSGAIVAALSFAFFEKSVLVPIVACMTVVLLNHVDGIESPIRSAVRGGRALWIPLVVVTAVWTVAYPAFTESRFNVPSAAQTAGLVHHGTSLGLVPTLLGGPWAWERWSPSPPWATPPIALAVLGWAAVLAALAWSLIRKRRTGAVWLSMVAYIAASEAAMVSTRSGPDTAYELAQTLRYVADSAVVIAIGWALIAHAPRRPGARVLPQPQPVLVAGLTALFFVSSMWSTVTFVQRWRESPTVDYLANVRESLAANRNTPLLDQPVSIWVLLPVAYPHNMASGIFGPLRERPEFARSTNYLQLLDDSGRLVPAAVAPARNIGQGPVPGCGYLVEGGAAEIPLDGPLIDWEWTAQLTYLASADGKIEVGFGDGREVTDPVTVPVQAGLNHAFVRLFGAGDTLRVRPMTPGLALCIGAGPVGSVVPAPRSGE